LQLVKKFDTGDILFRGFSNCDFTNDLNQFLISVGGPYYEDPMYTIQFWDINTIEISRKIQNAGYGCLSPDNTKLYSLDLSGITLINISSPDNVHEKAIQNSIYYSDSKIYYDLTSEDFSNAECQVFDLNGEAVFEVKKLC
jgi:hypothetical protein